MEYGRDEYAPEKAHAEEARGVKRLQGSSFNGQLTERIPTPDNEDRKDGFGKNGPRYK